MLDLKLVSNYVFNPTLKTVTFSDYATIRLENIQLVRNLSGLSVLYVADNPLLGGSVSGNVLTLNTETSEMSNTDKLQIFYLVDTNTNVTVTCSGGSGGGTDTVTKLAGQTISSGMVVIIDIDENVYKYDITNENHAGITCGIAKTSGTIGGSIDVTLPGNIHTEVGSGWVAGKSYYVGATSLLTDIPPTTGIIKKIATGLGVDTVFINDYNEFITI